MGKLTPTQIKQIHHDAINHLNGVFAIDSYLIALRNLGSPFPDSELEQLNHCIGRLINPMPTLIRVDHSLHPRFAVGENLIQIPDYSHALHFIGAIFSMSVAPESFDEGEYRKAFMQRYETQLIPFQNKGALVTYDVKDLPTVLPSDPIRSVRTRISEVLIDQPNQILAHSEQAIDNLKEALRQIGQNPNTVDGFGI